MRLKAKGFEAGDPATATGGVPGAGEGDEVPTFPEGCKNVKDNGLVVPAPPMTATPPPALPNCCVSPKCELT